MCLLVTTVSIDGILAELEGKHVLATRVHLWLHMYLCVYMSKLAMLN